MNSEQKADEMHVNPAIASPLLPAGLSNYCSPTNIFSSFRSKKNLSFANSSAVFFPT
jgi:hypothetical protein